MTRIEKLCADKGLRMTEQRRVIARVLSDAADRADRARAVADRGAAGLHDAAAALAGLLP